MRKEVFRKLVSQQSLETILPIAESPFSVFTPPTNQATPVTQRSRTSLASRVLESLSIDSSDSRNKFDRVVGQYVIDPGGPYQEFVLRVEDAILGHIFGQKLYPSFVQELCKYLDSKISAPVKNESSSTYVHCPTGRVRYLVRLLAQQEPSTLMDIIEQGFDAACDIYNREIDVGTDGNRALAIPFRRPALKEHCRSMVELRDSFNINCCVLADEPCIEVFHVTKSMLPNSISDSRELWQRFALGISGCGSEQLRGVFLPNLSGLSSNPCYLHENGAIISRSEAIIGTSIDRPQNENADEGGIHMFIWYLRHPNLGVFYYFCRTIDPTPLPPLLGWKTCGLGVVPVPRLGIILDFPKHHKILQKAVDESTTIKSQGSLPLSSSEFVALVSNDSNGLPPIAPSKSKNKKLVQIAASEEESLYSSSNCIISRISRIRSNSRKSLRDVDLDEENFNVHMRLPKLERKLEEPLFSLSSAFERHRELGARIERYCDNLLKLVKLKRLWLTVASSEDIKHGLSMENDCIYGLEWFERCHAEPEGWIVPENLNINSSILNPAINSQGSNRIRAVSQGIWNLDNVISKRAVFQKMKIELSQYHRCILSNKTSIAGESIAVSPDLQVNEVRSSSTINSEISQDSLSSDLLPQSKEGLSATLPTLSRNYEVSMTPRKLSISGNFESSAVELGVQSSYSLLAATFLPLSSGLNNATSTVYSRSGEYVNLNAKRLELLRDDGGEPIVEGVDWEDDDDEDQVEERVSNDASNIVFSEGRDVDPLPSAALPVSNRFTRMLESLNSSYLRQAEVEVLGIEFRKVKNRVGATSDRIFFLIRLSLPDWMPPKDIFNNLSGVDRSDASLEYFSLCKAVIMLMRNSAHLFGRRVITLRRDIHSFVELDSRLTCALDLYRDCFPEPIVVGTLNFEELAKIETILLGHLESQIRNVGPHPYIYAETTVRTVSDTFDRELPISSRLLARAQEMIDAVQSYVCSIFSFAGQLVCDQVGSQASQNYDWITAIGQEIGSFFSSDDLTAGHNLVHPVRHLSAEVDVQSAWKRPCWFKFLEGGLVFQIIPSTTDMNIGVNVKLKSEQELLRLQRSQCLGCGSSLFSSTGIFGIGTSNYYFCHFLGGLLCRRWCFARKLQAGYCTESGVLPSELKIRQTQSEHVVPYRVIRNWDCKAYTLSAAASRYIEASNRFPIFSLSQLNPLLYDGVPGLSMVRSVRKRIIQLIIKLLADTSVDTNQVFAYLSTYLGDLKIHLCLGTDHYCLEDLCLIVHGRLANRLQLLVQALVKLLRSS